jgi:hypothetical protein
LLKFECHSNIRSIAWGRIMVKVDHFVKP